MNFLKNIFEKKEYLIKNYADFWIWFQKNDQKFHEAVKKHQNIEKYFFDKLTPKLAELKEGYFFLTGMLNDDTVELVFTADRNIKNIVFVEELVKAAPQISGWKFTALKPAINTENISVTMSGLVFNLGNLFFYSNDLPDYPDEIDICIVHSDMTDNNIEQIANDIYIFLYNYLGELDFVNIIDNLEIISKKEAQKELIPISKLKDFLTWRQKEFVEKYDGVKYNTKNDEYSILEAELENGDMLLALVNTSLLSWDRPASHPWVAILIIHYDGSDYGGMPSNNDYKYINAIEQEVMTSLIDKEGYLNIARQTASNEREIYFACKDFRKPSKVFYEIQQKYHDKFDIEFDIYKDKYWQTFEQFK